MHFEEEEADMNTWEKALTIMKEALSVPTYETLFRPVQFDSETDTDIILKVPSEFVKELLETKYSSLIESTLSELKGSQVSVNFIVEEKRHEQAETIIIPQNLTLNRNYTFEEFVVGTGNRMAHAASLAVANNPGRAYNPLYIYGGVGLGKTHLLHAIAYRLIKNFNKLNILYVTTEEFTNEVIYAIQNAKSNGDLIDKFHKKYRNVDVLLVDDIQFIAGKERTQEEFFHTFNALHNAGKQIVITSDCSPKDIATLEERLKTRFEWGLTVDIQSPDFETRVAILRKKAEKMQVSIDSDVFEYIAKNVYTNIRELEGALIRLVAKASLFNEEITLQFAEKALADIFSTCNEPITVEKIKKIIADYFNLDIPELSDKKRDQKIVFPRQIAMYLTRKLTDLSLPQIGEAFGGRDHTTVMHAYSKIEESYKKEETLRAIIDEITNKLKE